MAAKPPPSGSVVSDRHRDPQSRTTEKRSGAHIASVGTSGDFVHLGETDPTHPRQRATSLFQHQPGKLTSICACWRGHAAELGGRWRGLIVTPRSDSEGPSFLWKDFGQRASQGLVCVNWEGPVLLTSSTPVVPCPLTCKTTRSAPCCSDPRQRGMALGWKCCSV